MILDDGMQWNDDGTPVSGEELLRRMEQWEQENQVSPAQDDHLDDQEPS